MVQIVQRTLLRNLGVFSHHQSMENNTFIEQSDKQLEEEIRVAVRTDHLDASLPGMVRFHIYDIGG